MFNLIVISIVKMKTNYASMALLKQIRHMELPLSSRIGKQIRLENTWYHMLVHLMQNGKKQSSTISAQHLKLLIKL